MVYNRQSLIGLAIFCFEKFCYIRCVRDFFIFRKKEYTCYQLKM